MRETTPSQTRPHVRACERLWTVTGPAGVLVAVAVLAGLGTLVVLAGLAVVVVAAVSSWLG